MKLLTKPKRDIQKGTPLIQDRIEFLRCILNYDIPRFARKTGVSQKGYEGMVIHNKEARLLSFIDTLEAVFGVDRNWLLTNQGRPYKKGYSEHIYTETKPGRKYREPVGRGSIAERFKEVRERLDMTQTVFGATLGESFVTINRIENGERSASIELVNKLVLKYGVPDAWILRGEGVLSMSVGKKVKGH
jgi:DNA-binding XRE family transcriptional regulator